MGWVTRFPKRDSVPAGLYTKVFGSGTETLVFIPGLGGTTRYWESGVQSLGDRYRIVLIDLLGFGESPKPWTQYTVNRQMLELEAVLKTYGQLTLIGHSLGALLAIAFADRFPGSVSKVVLIGLPYFGSQRKAYRYMRQGPVKGGFLFTNVVLTMIACILTRRIFGRVLPYILRHVPREVAEDLVRHTWRSSTSSLWEVVYRYDAAVDLRRLPEEIGVLCIHGERDLMAPVEAIQDLLGQHPRWRLHVLPGVDHHPFLREPAECRSLITMDLKKR